jgi:hypothetical protein
MRIGYTRVSTMMTYSICNGTLWKRRSPQKTRKLGLSDGRSLLGEKDHHLKSEPDRDLCAVQRQLIEEVGVAEVIIIIPVTNLGKDVTGELAT